MKLGDALKDVGFAATQRAAEVTLKSFMEEIGISDQTSEKIIVGLEISEAAVQGVRDSVKMGNLNPSNLIKQSAKNYIDNQIKSELLDSTLKEANMDEKFDKHPKEAGIKAAILLKIFPKTIIKLFTIWRLCIKRKMQGIGVMITLMKIKIRQIVK
jgi:hypothetical protein